VRTDDPADAPGTVVWILGPVIARCDVPALCGRMATFLDRGATLVICDVSAVTRADVATIDALARLHLIAGRHGARILVRGADSRLVGLLCLVGLREVLPLT
jgi:ABC-type transporter Mla MlaB component